VLGLIPLIGGAVGIALTTYLVVISSMEVHKIPSQKAWLVFGIIGAIFVILSISGEITSKRVAREAARFRKEAEKASKMMQKQAEDAAKQIQKSAEEAQKVLEETQEQMKKSQENKN
jgi:type VI protein secretion system component VasK